MTDKIISYAKPTCKRGPYAVNTHAYELNIIWRCGGDPMWHLQWAFPVVTESTVQYDVSNSQYRIAKARNKIGRRYFRGKIFSREDIFPGIYFPGNIFSLEDIFARRYFRVNSIFAKISSRGNISNSLFAKFSSRENSVLYSSYSTSQTPKYYKP